MRIGKGITTPGRVLFLLLATAFPWKAGAEEVPLPVSHYVEAAFANNPSLNAMRERIRIKENAAIRAGALDDPKAWIGITNVPVTSWSFREEDMTGKEIGLSQLIPYPGKLRLRTEVATREKEQTEFDLQEVRNVLRAEIRMAYADLSSVRRQAEVVRRTREILREIVAVSQEMYAVGRVTQADVHRGQVEFEKLREVLLVLENREKVLSIRLNTLSALPPGLPVPALLDLQEFAFPYRQDELMAMYNEERPLRKSLEARVLRGEASIALARKEYYPDFEISGSYMQRDDTPDGARRSDMFSSSVLVNLPIWRKQKLDPLVREMTAEREMARRELANQDLETSNAIGRSLATIRNRAEVAALYRTTIIPHGETNFETTLAAYRVGKVDFPALLDTITNLLFFRKGYHETVGDLNVEKARLGAVVGKDLD
ncbi:TolC family protein [Candidatus Deferrimicrobium sp.]|uniref:TolC family protein n=1 Tax=Candidatus Deferrimicrobium sp. TaxID=3060586 RepID=UPI002ED388BF